MHACSWPPREEKSDSQIKHYKRISNNIHGCAWYAPSHALSCNRNKMEYSQLALAMVLDLTEAENDILVHVRIRVHDHIY